MEGLILTAVLTDKDCEDHKRGNRHKATAIQALGQQHEIHIFPHTLMLSEHRRERKSWKAFVSIRDNNRFCLHILELTFGATRLAPKHPFLKTPRKHRQIAALNFGGNKSMKSVAAFLTLVLISSFSAVTFANDFSNETLEVQNALANKAITKSVHYCVAGTLTCRTIVLLNDSATGLPAENFYNVFLSSERAVGSTGHFLKNANGNYRIYGDEKFDGIVGITQVVAENQDLRVTFDSAGLPTVHDMRLGRLGTTRFILATLTYDSAQASIIGTEYDAADANYKVPVEIIYKRLQ